MPIDHVGAAGLGGEEPDLAGGSGVKGSFIHDAAPQQPCQAGLPGRSSALPCPVVAGEQPVLGPRGGATEGISQPGKGFLVVGVLDGHGIELGHQLGARQGRQTVVHRDRQSLHTGSMRRCAPAAWQGAR